MKSDTEVSLDNCRWTRMKKPISRKPEVGEQAAAACKSLQSGMCLDINEHFFVPISRTTTTVLKAVTAVCCVTATRSALSPEHVTERVASVSVRPVSSDASVNAVTTPLLRFLLTAVRVRMCVIKSLQSLIDYPCYINILIYNSNLDPHHLFPPARSSLSVIYDSCPQAIEAGIWWPRTKFGLPAAVSCPKGTLGMIVLQIHCQITI